MVVTNLKQQFAHRLGEVMINAGFISKRSTSGIDIQKLVEITGYSIQICRKYLSGHTMPELSKLQEIAIVLEVSPGWLAFGDNKYNAVENKEKILINTTSLNYIFSKALLLDFNLLEPNKVSLFFLELINTLDSINGTEEQNTKIIDLAFKTVQNNFFEK